MRLNALLSLASLLPSAFAVFADDAYHTDYHHALLGLPQEHTTFFQQPYAGSKASLIYTLSDKLVLGAVNPKDGEIVWRQSLNSPNATKGCLRAGEGQDTVVTAVGSQVAAWSAADGRLAWSREFVSGDVADLEILEIDDTALSSGPKDVLLLFNGSSPIVSRLDGKTGEAKWNFEDTSGDAPFQVLASGTGVHYISLHTTLLGGLKIKVVSLDQSTGHKIDQYSLSSDNDLASTDSVLFVGANSASPILAWIDKSRKALKINIIGTKSVASFSIGGGNGEKIEKIALHAPHSINSLPHFLVQVQTAQSHWADVYHIDLKGSSISKAYSLPKLPGKGAFATSTVDANVFFTRITADEVAVVSSVSHGILGRWPVKGLAAPGLTGQVYPTSAISEVAARSGSAQAVRSAVLLSSGDWLLIRNGEVTWSRPESLAGATAAIWAELPETEALAHELEIESHGSILAAYIHRVKRHARDLRNLPGWLRQLPKRILTNLAGGSTREPSDDLRKDNFGFSKLVVVATEKGRMAALSAGGSGKILWSMDVVPLATGGKWTPQLRTSSGGAIAILDQSKGLNLLLDAATGKLLPVDDSHVNSAFRHSPSGSTIVSYSLVEGEVQAHLPGQDNADPLWRFLPATDESILEITPRPANDPVASIGKVLGDRRVMYKYLNPNLVLVTAIQKTASSMSMYLLDSTTGDVLYTASHGGVDVARRITSAVSENWFTYSYTLDASSNSSSRGHQLVVVELYESAIPNDRGPLDTAANYSSFQPAAGLGDAAKPHVVSQTFQIPEEISLMSVTRTRQGITSRQLLAVLPDSNSIVGIPRNVIDPRRPVGRDPTPAEVTEGLVRYSPVVDFDPKWYLNHKREVFGIVGLITSPALLESTSLVFAYGQDLFGTRVTPSFSFDVLGKDFNKLQMLATVAALFVGVLFVAPLVRRKQINTRWQIL